MYHTNLDAATFDTYFSSYISVMESTIDKHAPHKRLTRKEKKSKGNHG